MSQYYYLEVRLAKQLGSSIERFKVKKECPFHGQGRCPVCGDSAKNKAKTRFHIIERESKLFVHCFNCDLSTSLVTFLKQQYPPLYNEYIFERYKSSDSRPIITEPEFVVQKICIKTKLGLPYVADLPDDHYVKKYVQSRLIPDYPFQVTDRYFEFTSQYNPDIKYEPGQKDEMRLIIPFFDRDGNVHAFQGRDMSGKSGQKYITTVVNEKIPKIFGICSVDFKKPILLVEGPIDSLFLPNCIASINANLTATAVKLTKINKTLFDTLTLVLDNEPRNVSIVKQYEKAIDAGYKIVIWPTGIKDKDINDMVLSGLNPLKIIEKNTYRGLTAKLELMKWKRC